MKSFTGTSFYHMAWAYVIFSSFFGLDSCPVMFFLLCTLLWIPQVSLSLVAQPQSLWSVSRSVSSNVASSIQGGYFLTRL